MRVAVVGQPWNAVGPGVTWGSISIWIDQVTRRLPPGFEVTAYGRRVGDEPVEEPAGGVVYRRYRTGVERRALGGIRPLRRLLRARTPLFVSGAWYPRYIRRVVRDARRRGAELFHVMNFPQFASLAKRANPGAITLLHMHCEWLSSLPLEVVNRHLRYVDHVVACSDHVRDKVIARFPELARRCHTLRNGVDLELFDVPRPEPAGKTIAYVGRVSPEKGVHILVEAFEKVLERHPDARLEIVGPAGVPHADFRSYFGDEALARRLERHWTDDFVPALAARARRLGGNHVSLGGAVPHQELPPVYARAAVLANPSLTDAYPMAVLEALASGLPVVATRVGGVVEVLDGQGAGELVPPEDPVALADALVRVLDDSAGRESMGRRARERAREFCSWDRIAHDTAKLYREIA